MAHGVLMVLSKTNGVIKGHGARNMRTQSFQIEPGCQSVNRKHSLDCVATILLCFTSWIFVHFGGYSRPIKLLAGTTVVGTVQSITSSEC